jgi:hypothetical protein
MNQLFVTRMRPVALAVTFALCSSLAACGGDDDSPVASSASATTPTPNPTPAPVPTAFSAAVYGDTPYGIAAAAPFVDGAGKSHVVSDLTEFKAMPSFIGNINGDKSLSLAMHVGDLHSGSEPCTQVYDQAIAKFFSTFALPLVYTPGDNEWTDCHKSKQMLGVYSETSPDLPGYAVNTPMTSYMGGNPADNLDLVRSLFFTNAGQTLGSGSLVVHSQAQEGKTDADKKFVENVWWMQNGVLFVTANIPGGSNNDTDVWFGAATATDRQNQEVATRTTAVKNWLNNAFDQAVANGASAVVIAEQADMWSSENIAAGSDPAAGIPHLSQYQQFIDIIADRTAKFGKPVLLLNGDTHLFQSDNPLMKGAACVKESSSAPGGVAQACSFDPYIANPNATYAVKNFHRVVVHGSTLPMEWLKLRFDPGANADNGNYAYGPFSWERVLPVLK